MPLSLADNLNPDIDRPLDARTYWPSRSAALAGIKPTQRTKAMFIWIGDQTCWYQFQGGLADEHLLPAPFETIKQWYTQLPLPDTVRDTQDIPIGTTAVFRNGNAPSAGWLPVVPGSPFDKFAYPSLYAFLGDDVFPNETSDEGTVWIKAEQVSLTHTNAMSVFPFTGGLYDPLFANAVAAINVLWADMNYNEEMRRKILTELLKAPAGANDSWTTVYGHLHAFKQTLSVMLNNKAVPATALETFLDLIKKVGSISVSPDAMKTGLYVQCRIGATIVRATCPGPGWLECDGRELDAPETTGLPLLYPEYYDVVYNAIGAAENRFGPFAVATPNMTSDIAPLGIMSVLIGTTKLPIGSMHHWLHTSSTSCAVPITTYQWATATQPLIVEYLFGGTTDAEVRLRKIVKLGLLFADVTCYPTHFKVQGYSQERDAWVDLLVVEDFQPTLTEAPHEFTFKNDHGVSGVRLVMTAGVSNATNALSLTEILFYEYRHFKLPDTSNPGRRVWIKAATGNNDIGFAARRCLAGSDLILPNEPVFWDDNIDSVTSQKSYPVCSSAAHFDVAEYNHEGHMFRFFGSSSTGSSTCYRRLEMIPDTDVSSTTCISNTSSTQGSPARFFMHKGKLHFVAGSFIIHRLDFPEHLASTPTTAWVPIWTGSGGAQLAYNSTDICHFDSEDGEEHYSYHCLSSSPYFRCMKWPDGFTANPTTELPMSPSLGFTAAFTKANTHFFRHEGVLHFFCYDIAAAKLKMFRQEAPDQLVLLQVAALPYTPLSGPYLALPSPGQIVLHDGKYVFGCGWTHSGYDVASGSRTEASSTHIGLYDFETNTFEFPELRCLNGYVAATLPSSVLCRIGLIEGEIHLIAASIANYMYRVDLDARTIHSPEPFQTRAFVLSAGTEVFQLGDRTLIASTTSTLIDPGLRQVKTAADFIRTGTFAKSSGRLMVSLEGATKGNTLLCQPLCPSPVTLTPALFAVTGGPSVTANNFQLPRRST